MADEIKIKIGVQNNVKAGMDGVVRDIESGTRRAVARDRSGSGKGFAEAFGKAIRGDFSGAVEEMQERMNAGMKSTWAKAAVWGAGIASALVAGFKAGQALDQMLGLSDKIANIFVKPTAQGLDPATKALREARLKREADAGKEKQAYQDTLKKDNEEAQARIDAEGDEAVQRAMQVKNFEAQRDAMGKKQSLVGRLMGRADLDPRAAVDRESRLALDNDFRKSEAHAEKLVARQERRAAALLKRAEDPRQRRYSPQLQRIFEADQKQAALAKVEEDLKLRQKQAAEAQIKMAADTALIKANTAEIKDLKAFLAMK